MKYFNEDFISFFKELEQNNTKEWFDQNRKRYEKTVKNPFKKFIIELIYQIQEIDSDIKIEAKNAITRINRDLRFSKNKIPYNTHIGAIISSTGRKDKKVPGIYIKLSANTLSIFGGAYMIEPKALQKLRCKINNNLNEFSRLIFNKDFRNTFDKILGEKSKRIPEEFRAIIDHEPLIANKQFYFTAIFDINTILKDNLLEKIVRHYKIAKPLNDFLTNPL